MHRTRTPLALLAVLVLGVLSLLPVSAAQARVEATRVVELSATPPSGTVQVTVGEVVVFRNVDDVAHRLTLTGAWSGSPTIPAGSESGTYALSAPGDYTFVDESNRGLLGVDYRRGSSTFSASPAPSPAPATPPPAAPADPGAPPAGGGAAPGAGAGGGAPGSAGAAGGGVVGAGLGAGLALKVEEPRR